MKARSCGHADCLAKLDAALAARKTEMYRPTEPGEPMATVHSSHGQFQIPKRLADADIALDAVMRCSR